MRTLVLALALAVWSDAHAQATVLSHDVTVVVDASKRATTTVRWEVRIDDPEGCTAGLVAPSGLDGAASGTATVLEDTLLVGEAGAGEVLVLEQTTTSPLRGSHSGAFLTAPDLLTEHARFEIRAPSNQPLHVWHDPAGTPEISASGGRRAVVEWNAVKPGAKAEAVWSTWQDWMAAGTEIEAAVDEKLTGRSGLGREMANGYTGLHVAEAAERVFAAIALDPYGTSNWVEARPAEETMAAGSGSPVDRGVVLISLLKLAGHEVEPGYYRPANTRGTFPVTIPAPSMLGRPVIVVRDDDGDIYIDPAGDFVRVPRPPADLIGGVSWLPGDLPTPWQAAAAVDGEVTINGSLTIKGDGAANWSAELTANGVAEQRLRELLGPLNDEERVEALRQRVLQGRPELTRFTASTSGVEKVRTNLKISMSGYDEALLAPVGAGLGGEVPALIAPALAGWLPPNIQVREVLSIQVPQAVEIISAGTPTAGYHESALLSRHSERRGARIQLITTVERPYRVSTSALEVEAAAVLAEEARRGPNLLAHTAASGSTIGLLHQTDLPEIDKLVIESVLWWRQRVPGKTSKPLKTGIAEHGGKATAEALERYGAGERKLWSMLYGHASKHGDVVDQLEVLVAAARSGHRDLAWEWAGEIGADEDAEASHRAEAWLYCLSLQPEAAPHPDADPDAHARWAEPSELIARAEALGGAADPRIAFEKARLARQAANWAGVLVALDQVPAASRTPAAKALMAQAQAELGASVSEVMAAVGAALQAAPHDADVLGAAAAVATRVGQHQPAVRYALTAARIDPDTPERWDVLVEAALGAGDLPTALLAARSASDLKPRDLARAETLALVSVMAYDEQGWNTARTRNPGALPSVDTWRPTVHELMEIAPASALLAVLQHHDAAVVADPALLGIRAQMRMDAGLVDLAARDGVLLASRYGQADGVALAFAASAGRMYSSTWPDRLREAAEQSVTARATRMEIALLLGNGDPTTDARKLTEDPRAEIVNRLRNDPKGLAAEVQDWPLDGQSPPLQIPGFRPNARLGAVPGVTAISNPESGVTLLRTAAFDGLPPPLHQLYTPGDQALAQTAAGGVVVRLEGGTVPLFHASVPLAGDTPTRLHALAFSVDAAVRAVATALE